MEVCVLALRLPQVYHSAWNACSQALGMGEVFKWESYPLFQGVRSALLPFLDCVMQCPKIVSIFMKTQFKIWKSWIGQQPSTLSNELERLARERTKIGYIVVSRIDGWKAAKSGKKGFWTDGIVGYDYLET